MLSPPSCRAPFAATGQLGGHGRGAVPHPSAQAHPPRHADPRCARATIAANCPPPWVHWQHRFTGSVLATERRLVHVTEGPRGSLGHWDVICGRDPWMGSPWSLPWRGYYGGRPRADSGASHGACTAAAPPSDSARRTFINQKATGVPFSRHGLHPRTTAGSRHPGGSPRLLHAPCLLLTAIPMPLARRHVP